MPFKSARELVGVRPLPLRVNIWGEQKTGKTSFALTFPRPIHHFNFDRPLLDLLEQNPALSDDLYMENYYLPANATQEQGEELLQQFVDDWTEAALVAGGTMILDTGTDLKELVTFVKIQQKFEEKLKRAEALAKRKKEEFDPDSVMIQMSDYGPRNQLMRAILSLPALAEGKNAVFVWKAKEKFSGNGQPTGQFAGDLFKDAPYIAQATLARKRLGYGKSVSFATVIEDNTFDQSLNGETLSTDVIANYEDLRGMLV
jgi:hypothetical protein